MKIPRIIITAGEPAGIGPDIIIQIAQLSFAAELVVVADSTLLLERAKNLHLPLSLSAFDATQSAEMHAPAQLKIINVPGYVNSKSGKLDVANAHYVLESLSIAAKQCQQKKFDALVTAPVHKGIINEAGIAFRGHTEFFADIAGVKDVVMMLATQGLRVALVTTHLPLVKVPAAITKEKLHSTLTIIFQELPKYFSIKNPRILVCGLNPHAGENGHLGREEINTIIPVINEFAAQGYQILGPLPADTIFTEKYLTRADCVVAMYHDQGLPVLKYKGFGNAVNITLGLPFIRTSVDHGTALDVAGTGKADPASLKLAIETAIEMAQSISKTH